MKPLGIAGRRFGRLTALLFVESRLAGTKRCRIWRCMCECGAIVEIPISYLTSGDTRSCGCWTKELDAQGRRTKHSGSGTAEFIVWIGMRQRCGNPSNKAYRDYGGRGITVCARWNRFEQFLRDMGPRPSADHSIDRIDNNKGYSPENCRWALRTDQANNRRSNRLITFHGETKTLARWASDLGIPQSTIWNRLNAGMPIEVIFNANHL